MPAWLGEPNLFGAKLVSVFLGNHSLGLSSHQGIVIIFEYRNRPAGGDSGGHDAVNHCLHPHRGGERGGGTLRVLPADDASTLTVLGYGATGARTCGGHGGCAPDQAGDRLGPVVRERLKPLPRPERGRAPDARFDAAETIEAAVAPADTVTRTTTAAREPILKGAWVKPGTDANAVGASQPNVAEVDSDLVAKSRYYVDFIPSAEAEKRPEHRTALAEGADPTEDHILGEVGAVLDGTAPGRQSADDITLYESLGFAAEDLATASFVLDRAREQNVGVAGRSARRPSVSSPRT